MLVVSSGSVLRLDELQLFMDADTELVQRHRLGELQLSEFSEQANVFQRYSKNNLHHPRHRHVSVLQYFLSFSIMSVTICAYSHQTENCKFGLPIDFSCQCLSLTEMY